MTNVRRVSNAPNPWSDTVEYLDEIPTTRLEIFEDQTLSILSRNDPDEVGFEFGLNPYRGCQHACAYCEARRRHELLGFGAGTDFETKIVVKPNAPDLLRAAFESKSWRGDVIVFSGATDCAEYQNPLAIITKGALIERDLDVLLPLRDRARPFILGLSEHGLGELLREAKDAGAARATLSFLRLPTPVDIVFTDRVRQVMPQRTNLIFARARAPGGYAELAAALYATTCRRLALPFSRAGDDRTNTPDAGPLASRTLTGPARAGHQLGLFGR